MILDKCKIVVFPEYHIMGRLINEINNENVGTRIKGDLYCIEGAPIVDNFCISSWFRGDSLSLKSGNLEIESTGDKEWNNLILQGKSGIANVFINGRHSKRIRNIDKIPAKSLYLRASPTTSDSPPLRDFRYYERSLSEKELEDIAYGILAKSYIEIYASNAANMFPTHF